MDDSLRFALAIARVNVNRVRILMEEQRRIERRRYRRMWMRKLFVNRNLSLLNDINAEVETTRNFLRMSQDDFEYLLAAIAPVITKQDTNMRNAITARERLCIALRFFATGDVYASLQYTFRVSKSSISKIVPEVCDAIITVLRNGEYIKLPTTPGEWLTIAKEFEQRWNFPHVIGAMDGKHVVIKAPKHSGTEYYNYKGTFSIVLMAIVDANYNFLFADAGCQGKISDGGVLANTIIKRKLANNELNIPTPDILRIPYSIKVPYMLLGDKAFAMTEWCLRPFANNTNPRTAERHFNYRHSRARRVVENVFGIITSVFRVLRTTMELEPKIAEKVVLTIVYLHNFLRKRNSRNSYTPVGIFDRYTNEDNVIPGTWRNDVAIGSSMLDLQSTSRNMSRNMHDIRQHIAHDLFMNNQLR